MASGSELPLELSGLGLVAGSLTIPSLEDDANRRQVYHPKPTTATQLAHNTRNLPHSAFRFESPCDHFPLVGNPETGFEEVGRIGNHKSACTKCSSHEFPIVVGSQAIRK